MDEPSSREVKVRELCQLHQGKFSLGTAQSILREHQGNICIHGAFETAGSQISSLAAAGYEHWFITQPFLCQQGYQTKDFS
jgi:secernin